MRDAISDVVEGTRLNVGTGGRPLWTHESSRRVSVPRRDIVTVGAKRSGTQGGLIRGGGVGSDRINVYFHFAQRRAS